LTDNDETTLSGSAFQIQRRQSEQHGQQRLTV